MKNLFCSYYQAQVKIKKTWFVVGVFRNEDHLAFERAVKGKKGFLEFFVPPDQETYFIQLMNCLKDKGYVLDFEKMPNRFAQFRTTPKQT